jgi:hypothetical protein
VPALAGCLPAGDIKRGLCLRKPYLVVARVEPNEYLTTLNVLVIVHEHGFDCAGDAGADRMNMSGNICVIGLLVRLCPQPVSDRPRACSGKCEERSCCEDLFSNRRSFSKY